MPTIRIEMFEGRTAVQKRELVAALTEACVRTLGGSAESVNIVLFDVARENWATGGILWSDKLALVESVKPIKSADTAEVAP